MTIVSYARHRTERPARNVNNADSCVTFYSPQTQRKGNIMNNIVWIVGAVVIVIAVLSFFGLR